jgi:hypothetical protein
VTSKKQLKTRIRARMAKTGESYTTALRQVLGTDLAPYPAPSGASDHGYRLRGGLHPETANIANVLAHHGVTASGRPIGEALVLGIGGGLGAGYILWEFKAHGSRSLVVGFRNQWNYPDRWTAKTLTRLGVPYQAHHTGGAKAAADRLTAELSAGRPCIVRPDRYHIGYWRLPAHLDGYGGHDMVAIAEDGDGVHLDDRNVSPLTVPRDVLDRARGRVGSYKNSLYVIEPGSADISAGALRSAVRAGLADCVEHLGGGSASFALPAWAKWARLMTDTRNAKAWPKVFADRRGLAGALLSVWEGTVPMGMSGGHLRGLYAEFLDEAAALLAGPGGGEGRDGGGGRGASGGSDLRSESGKNIGRDGDDEIGDLLRHAATAFRQAARGWERLAEIAMPGDVPELVRLRELTSTIRETVADPAGSSTRASGDPSAGTSAGSSTGSSAEIDTVTAQLWELREALDRDFPLDDTAVSELFAAMGETLTEVHERESAAIKLLGKAASSRDSE